MFSKAFKKKLKETLYTRYRLTILRGQIVLDMKHLPDLTSRDLLRICSLRAVADEIHAKGIPGNAAELGVYQGDFAKHIHSAFPDRNLYLFDTFEGFHETDREVEV